MPYRKPTTIATLLLLALLLALQIPGLIDTLRMAQAGRLLRNALLARAKAGDLPLGPNTPGIWALARAADEDSPTAPDGDAPHALALQEAADRLNQMQSSTLAQSSSYQRLRGEVFGALGQYAEAEQALRSAHTLDSADSFNSLALGNVLDAQGKREAANAVWRPVNAQRALSLQLYRRGITLAAGRDPSDGDGNRVQGTSQPPSVAPDSAEKTRALRQQARQMLELAVEIDPFYEEALHALAGFLWIEDRPRAVEVYRAALATGELQPFFEWFARGRIAMVERRLDDAVTAFQEAQRLRPDHADTTFSLGLVLSQVGRTDEALGYLQMAASLSPRASGPHVTMAQIHLDQGDFERAIADLQRAIERDSSQPQAFALLGRAYTAAGQPQQAVAAWQQATTLNPANAEYYLRLGESWQQAGQPDQAIAAYREALRIDPQGAQAGQRLKELGVEP